jgi:hypothetical protein
MSSDLFKEKRKTFFLVEKQLSGVGECPLCFLFVSVVSDGAARVSRGWIGLQPACF